MKTPIIKLIAITIVTIITTGCVTNRGTQDSEVFATIYPSFSLPACLSQNDENFRLNNDGRLLFCSTDHLPSQQLNHLYETTGTTIDALAMQKLPQPITTGKITFKADSMSALNVGRRNALIAFGDGEEPGNKMMWAGIYIGAKAYTIQSLNPQTYEVKADVFSEDPQMDQSKVFAICIEVDLTNRMVTLIVDDKKRGELTIPETVKKITHYGYAHHKNTISYYSDITFINE